MLCVVRILSAWGSCSQKQKVQVIRNTWEVEGLGGGLENGQNWEQMALVINGMTK